MTKRRDTTPEGMALGFLKGKESWDNDSTMGVSATVYINEVAALIRRVRRADARIAKSEAKRCPLTITCADWIAAAILALNKRRRDG